MTDEMLRRAKALLELLESTGRSDLLTDPACRGRDDSESAHFRRLQAGGAREMALSAYNRNRRNAKAAIDDLLPLLESSE